MERLAKIIMDGPRKVLCVLQGRSGTASVWQEFDQSREDKIKEALIDYVKYCDTGLTSEEITALRAENAALKRQSENHGPQKPEIVCLCGSTRFFKIFDEQNFKLTLEGKIVLSIGCNTKSDEGLSLTSADKIRLDDLHKRKIDLADRVLVLNVGGYIGDSTRGEIEYAKVTGKPVDYLETEENHENL